jgi:hypothetical protein
MGFMRFEIRKMKSHGEKEIRGRKRAAECYLEKVDWFANGAGVDMTPRDFVTDFCWALMSQAFGGRQ